MSPADLLREEEELPTRRDNWSFFGTKSTVYLSTGTFVCSC